MERFKRPKIIFGNACSISGITEQTKLRQQVVRDFIAREQPDIMGLIETNIQDGKYEMKGIGDYVSYKTEPNKSKGVMVMIKEEMHPIIARKLDNRAIAITIYEGAIAIMAVYATYKEDIKQVRERIEKKLPKNQGFILMEDFNSFQKNFEKPIEANWNHPKFTRMGGKRKCTQQNT